MYKEIDKDVIAKSEELYPINMGKRWNADIVLLEFADMGYDSRIAFQKGAMDERQRINEEISKIESWITENRPHLTGLGALTAMLKQVKAVETLPLQITKSN